MHSWYTFGMRANILHGWLSTLEAVLVHPCKFLYYLHIGSYCTVGTEMVHDVKLIWDLVLVHHCVRVYYIQYTQINVRAAVPLTEDLTGL